MWKKLLIYGLLVFMILITIAAASAETVFYNTTFKNNFTVNDTNIGAAIQADIDWYADKVNISDGSGVFFDGVNFSTYGMDCVLDSYSDSWSGASMVLLSSDFRDNYNNSCSDVDRSIVGVTVDTVRGISQSTYFDRSTQLGSIVINVSGIFMVNGSWTSQQGVSCYFDSLDLVKGGFQSQDVWSANLGSYVYSNFSCDVLSTNPGGVGGGGGASGGGGGSTVVNETLLNTSFVVVPSQLSTIKLLFSDKNSLFNASLSSNRVLDSCVVASVVGVTPLDSVVCSVDNNRVLLSVDFVDSLAPFSTSYGGVLSVSSTLGEVVEVPFKVSSFSVVFVDANGDLLLFKLFVLVASVALLVYFVVPKSSKRDFVRFKNP